MNRAIVPRTILIRALFIVPFILLSAVFVLAENEKSTVGCPDYKRPPDKLFYWPMPSDIAKRERRDVNERTTAAQNQQHFLTWDRNNNASLARWKTVIDGLPLSIRNALLTSSQNSEQITIADLTLLDPNTIAMLQGELGKLLTNDQLVQIVRGFLQRQQYREAAQVVERLASRLSSNPDLMINLWNEQQIGSQRCSKNVQTFIRQFLRLLTPPERWTSNLMKKYGTSLVAAMPSDLLMRFRDPQVASDILDRMVPATDGSFGCDFSKTDSLAEYSTFRTALLSNTRVQIKLMNIVLGDPITWTSDSLNRFMPIIPKLSSRTLSMIKGRVFSDSLNQLSSIKEWNQGQGFALVQTMAPINKSNTLSTTPYDQLGSYIDQMNLLGPYILPEFVMNSTKSLQSFLPIWASRMETLSKRGNSPLPKMTLSALVQYRLADIRDVSALSQQNLTQTLDTNYLNVAPWTLWKTALRSSDPSVLDKGQLQRMAFDPTASGLTDSQIIRLGGIAVRKVRNADHWDMATTPALYWAGANFSEFSSVPTREIQQGVQGKLIGISSKMREGGTLPVIYTKLRDDAVDLSSLDEIQSVKAMAPVTYLNRLSSPLISKLKILAADMPADSIIRQMYAAMALSGTTNATLLNTITSEPILVAHLAPENVMYLNVSDTPALLAAISSATQGPPPQTMRVLQDRLVNFTKARRLDVIDDDDISLLENTWLSNFDIYPATLLSGFSPEAIKGVSNIRKVELLRALGSLGMIQYYTIPKLKRVTILEQALHAMSKDSDPSSGQDSQISEEDLALMGNAVLDLPSSAIARLTPGAFENALLLFQGDVDVFKGLSARPCLTSDQRAAIRRGLKMVYGYPSSWNLGVVMAACCSLDTLSTVELDAIRDDLLLNGCPKCEVDDPAPFHLLALRQSLQAACLFELGASEIQNGLTLGNRQVLNRRATAAFNTYRKGRIYVPGINAPHLNQSNTPLTCDAVVAAGSGAGFTVEQLRSLSDEDVKDCLYELGALPLSQEQATQLWNRVKVAWGNRYPKTELVKLGYILPGMDVNSIISLRLDDSDVVAVFGAVDRQLSTQQLELIANRVVLDWKMGPELYTAQDLMTLGRLICGMNSTSVSRIPTTSYNQASAYLGTILSPHGCSLDVLAVLARKAMEQIVFGPTNGWTSAIVRNVGTVIAGLSADQLRKIPPSAMSGLTPSAIVSITPSNFRSMRTAQVQSFPLAVAQSLTSDQRYGLVEEMKWAIDSVIYGTPVRSSNGSNTLKSVGVFLVTLVLILIFN